MQIRSVVVVVVAALESASFAHGQQAVQWRVEDGGNGHWYGRLDLVASSWDDCRVSAHAIGSDMVSVQSAAEADVVRTVLDASGVLDRQYWLGGRAPAGSVGTSGWSWADGAKWSFSNWGQGFPNNSPGPARYLVEHANPNAPVPGWDDYGDSDAWCCVAGAIIEWSADCNDDGIVDYGQILNGTFADTNENGVPDCCDAGETCTPCPGDVTENGLVDGVDLSLVLSLWGTNGQKFPRSDTNADGIVDANDLAIVLSGWGNCP